jgi:hypothetical protein
MYLRFVLESYEVALYQMIGSGLGYPRDLLSAGEEMLIKACRENRCRADPDR